MKNFHNNCGTNVINLLQEVNQSIIVEYWCGDV